MTTDEEKLVLDNMDLAYDISWKFGKKFNGKIPIDEFQSLAFLGLTKAAKTYDIKLNNTFSTYAYTCIQNEIVMYLRQYNKYKDTKSLSEEVSDDFELEDTIASEENILENFIDAAAIDKLYEEINKLNTRHKAVMLYKLQGLTMADIGKILRVGQPQISRDYNKALNILRDKFKDWKED